jgi:hypothetical protein
MPLLTTADIKGLATLRLWQGRSANKAPALTAQRGTTVTDMRRSHDQCSVTHWHVLDVYVLAAGGVGRGGVGSCRPCLVGVCWQPLRLEQLNHRLIRHGLAGCSVIRSPWCFALLYHVLFHLYSCTTRIAECQIGCLYSRGAVQPPRFLLH